MARFDTPGRVAFRITAPSGRVTLDTWAEPGVDIEVTPLRGDEGSTQAAAETRIGPQLKSAVALVTPIARDTGQKIRDGVTAAINASTVVDADREQDPAAASLVHVTAWREQATALAEGGADLLWVETISAAEELAAAVEAPRRPGCRSSPP